MSGAGLHSHMLTRHYLFRGAIVTHVRVSIRRNLLHYIVFGSKQICVSNTQKHFNQV